MVFESRLCAWINCGAAPAVVACTDGAEAHLPRLRECCDSLPFLSNGPECCAGFRTVAAVPMFFRSHLAGVLLLADRPSGYPQRDLELLCEIGRVAVLQYEFLTAAEELDLIPSTRAAGQRFAHMVHKLRQPLSTIETAAVYLGMILPPHEIKVRSHLMVMREQVDYASRVLDQAAQAFENRIPASSAAEEREKSAPLTKVMIAGLTY